jgi:transcription elongation factor Elf1
MDFMFEDEVDEVGSDVEAYCPKCKADTTHVVISKYEEEIRRVQCNPCGDVHSFRKPRGETEDDVPEPVAAEEARVGGVLRSTFAERCEAL